jgi:hypothetical protein
MRWSGRIGCGTGLVTGRSCGPMEKPWARGAEQRQMEKSAASLELFMVPVQECYEGRL